ncbi:MAG: 50S ribosomal protein L11 methyltransferase [Limisphaerales bacterium]
MPSPPLWQICLHTTAEAEDAAIEALTSEFGAPASGYTDFETGAVLVSTYLESKPAGFETALKTIRARLLAAKQGRLNLGPATLEVRPVKRENWAESWKRHFKPLSIGGKLLLKPSWSCHRAKPGQKVIVLDPGLSFGTGHHATTSFCLREVVRFCERGGGSFLDMGTGSGILAIAAAKLGASPVEAFDHDPESVRVAHENARRNHVADKLRLTQADLTKQPQKPKRTYDLVCANLISNLLLQERHKIIARVAPGGTLVLAGILKTEFSKVQSAFEPAGLKLVRRRDEKEWSSGAFTLPRSADL